MVSKLRITWKQTVAEHRRQRREETVVGGQQEVGCAVDGSSRVRSLPRSTTLSAPSVSIMRASKMYANVSHAWFLKYGLSPGGGSRLPGNDDAAPRSSAAPATTGAFPYNP